MCIFAGVRTIVERNAFINIIYCCVQETAVSWFVQTCVTVGLCLVAN